MNESDNFIKVKNKLNGTSSSFCLAKWLQVSIHLQNGTTHSCHHPNVHKIPLTELSNNPTAVHNTEHKKAQRKLMLEGIRPKECQYCWDIEDNASEAFSDRVYKSADDWALPHFNEIKNSLVEENINPTYVEVSFGNECHFKCAYCSPTISSAILSEYLKFGHYKSNPYFELTHLKEVGEFPYSRDEFNPYTEAFWKWWPELKTKLEVFRITGGEPLLHPDTFKVLESIIKDPMPKLDFAINSNLSVPDKAFHKFIELSQLIVSKSLVKKFEIYTSLDTSGQQAEYIRHGLEIDRFIQNVEYVLDHLPNVKVIFMCTFNALSLPGFEKYLEIIRSLKLRYLLPDGSTRVILSISHLRLPAFLSVQMLPKRYLLYVEQSLNYMLRFSQGNGTFVFSEYEISQLRRILTSLKNQNAIDEKKILLQRKFFSFITEYDHRKNLNFEKTFPEFSDFYLNYKSKGFDP
jgi:organic radical activating enzyme